ncbi:helix-turn-helix transcriptional regulator [Aquibacillus sediminis]|uniref:helix-turn-helix transcriptional regulator n=1 Tax=Aquibacillus sediminis TaxID=2574734 RepID=UPI001109EDC4|nr:helix-turn-helix transcriptional regulator [Aquibacillus sediminis]
MALTYTVQEQIEHIKSLQSQEKQQIAILDTFLTHFPVLDIFLFRYSHIGSLGEGIISINEHHQLHYINDRHDVRSLPTIHSAIQKGEAKFYETREIFEKTSSLYVVDPDIHSFLIVPIAYSSHTLGYMYSTKMEKTIPSSKLLAMTQFGQECGDLLRQSDGMTNPSTLSKRELQVMKKIAEGETTKAISAQLKISEVTVKQYVKYALQKLNVNNRPQAIAEMFRKGLIR